MAQKKEDLAAIRMRLEQERASLLSDIAGLKADNQAPQDDAGIGNHIADDASEVFDRERDMALQATRRSCWCKWKQRSSVSIRVATAFARAVGKRSPLNALRRFRMRSMTLIAKPSSSKSAYNISERIVVTV